ncbi:ADP-ribosylation factor-binding protein GGA1-like [Lingula anatina]|uniref:ADP-ribosylation factor-binding protein GGA1-like n=1 Tax=Lingula anatina TaxID=7574 RepID=A0A1S3H731_LINAN|nr:ADP-ribosylation factor-binding protein GGA1-like [Lingula anatina]|eukprot:XP_013380934.1 ADP-ribosylation factor-binding protein GGA1-like [Lingula anatina]
MAEAEEEALEILLNKATSPLNREVEVDFMNGFCDQVNQELDGPMTAVRLLAHKIQSPQEREALYALTVLEACVKNCGKRFHQEIGKFRFLNELIKVVSPKYLGTKTTDKVKTKCIELIYSWTVGLRHEAKISEAYEMLKRQGIVKEDPVYIDKEDIPVPPPRPHNSIFDDEEKSKLLSRLLSSKHPEDLQAANRLIKNMVKQDAEKTEKKARRHTELETVNNNVKLLGDMLSHYKPGEGTASDIEIMKQLYETLDKHRPNLFRLASDADEKDDEGISAILKANDEVGRVMGQYRRLVDGTTQENGVAAAGDKGNSSDLLDLNFDTPMLGDTSSSALPASAPASGASTLDEDLASLGISASSNSATQASGAGSQDLGISSSGDLNQFGDFFKPSLVTGSTTAFSTNPSSAFANFNQQPQMIPPPRMQQQGNASSSFMQGSIPSANMNRPYPIQTAGAPIMASSVAPTAHTENAAPQLSQQKAMADLDELGKTVLQKHKADTNVKTFIPPPSQPVKVPLNQMQKSGAGAPLVSPSSPGGQASPAKRTDTSVQPLTDVFVPLESIQPGSTSPLNAYDKNGLKIIIHFGKDRPRADVMVMVVSVMSTNTSAVKALSFQAAVPKTMKVKLQPPSATDLPAFNPILPPSAITQVMLLANPHKEKIRVKFKLTFTMNDTPVTDVGEISNFPEESLL